MRITISRHGQPEINSRERIISSEMGDWISTYNNAPLSSGVPSKELQRLADEAVVIVCSDLRRSIESAELLSCKRKLLEDSRFREAGLPYGHVRVLKLRPTQWAVIFRCAWFLGYDKNSAHLADEKFRAKEAAKRLQELADEYENVLYVGHGIINRLIAKELASAGWHGAKPPSVYWGYSTFERTRT